MSDIHIIQLVDGTSIIGRIIDDYEKLLIEYPMVIDLSLGESGVPTLYFDKFLKLDTENTPIFISKAKVITYYKASDDLGKYYFEVVKKFVESYDPMLTKAFKKLADGPSESYHTYH